MMRRKVHSKVVKTAKVVKKVERKRKYDEMIDVQEVPDVESLSLKKKAMEIKTTDSGAPRKKRKVIKKDKPESDESSVEILSVPNNVTKGADSDSPPAQSPLLV